MRTESLPFLSSEKKKKNLFYLAVHQHKQVCPHPSTQKHIASTQSLFEKQAALGKKGWENFSTMFGNAWHAENPCWLPALLPGSQSTELQILLITSKHINFAAALSGFHHPCPNQQKDRRDLLLLPLKPTAGFPSMAKCQNLCLTR